MPDKHERTLFSKGARRRGPAAEADTASAQPYGLRSYGVSGSVVQSVQYPGEIKVNVIRETRAINYAR